MNDELDQAFNEYQRQHDILLNAYNESVIGNDEFDTRFQEVKQIYKNEIERIRRGEKRME